MIWRYKAACLTSQAFSDRIEQIQAQIITAESKLANFARLVKMSQTFVENQGEEISNQMKSIQKSMDACVNRVDKSYRVIESVEGMEKRLKALENVVQSIDKMLIAIGDVQQRETKGEIRASETRMMNLMEKLRQDVNLKIMTSENNVQSLMTRLDEVKDSTSKSVRDDVFELKNAAYGMIEKLQNEVKETNTSASVD